VETLGERMTVLIPRNTTIPVRKSETFTTAESGQTAVDIKVYQGERPMAPDNMLLGQFRLDGIPPAPRGVPQIEVAFDIDANGILNVSAKDKATGREQKITITASTNLSKEEVERLIQQAKVHEAEDRRKRDLVDARNEADALAFQMEKTLTDLGDKVPANVRSQIETKIADLKRVKDGDDSAAIRRAMDDLRQAAMQIGQQMYGEGEAPGGYAGPQGGPQSGPQRGPEGPDVVDGEYREM